MIVYLAGRLVHIEERPQCWIGENVMSLARRSFHVRGAGWVDATPSMWWLDRIQAPAPLPVYDDPDERRARVAERLRAAREALSPPRAPWPAPEVSMRTVEPAEAPSALQRAVKWLTAALWRSAVTYARGTAPDAQKRPGKVVDSWVIRASAPDGRRAALMWEGDGKLTNRGVLVLGDGGLRKIGLEQFRTEV